MYQIHDAKVNKIPVFSPIFLSTAVSEIDILTPATDDFERRKKLVIKRAQSSQDSKSDEPESAPAMNDEEKILAHVDQHGSINNAECRKLLSADLHHSSYLLKKLQQYGLLVREGKGRWARYSLAVDSAYNHRETP